MYSIIADKAQNYSNKEEVLLVLHYVDSIFYVEKDFISFVYCVNGPTGKNLASVLIEKIGSLGLAQKNGGVKHMMVLRMLPDKKVV